MPTLTMVQSCYLGLVIYSVCSVPLTNLQLPMVLRRFSRFRPRKRIIKVIKTVNLTFKGISRKNCILLTYGHDIS